MLMLLQTVVGKAVDVTVSQQAIVRVTPADDEQPFTVQSNRGGRKEKKK